MLQPTERPARLAGAAVGGLHDARAAAGHHREPGGGELAADLARERVVAVVVGEARRAEDGDARADEVQGAEAAQELGEDAEQARQLLPSQPGADEEVALLGGARGLAPFVTLLRRLLGGGAAFGRHLDRIARLGGARVVGHARDPKAGAPTQVG